MSTGHAVRRPLSVRAGSRQSLDLWLSLRFPRVAAFGHRLVLRLPRTSRIRQALLWRALRLGYEAFNATKQVNPHLLTSDVVLIEPDDDVLGGGVSRGREAVTSSSRKYTETWDDFRMEPEAFFDLGDRILVFVQLRGGARASGIPLDEPVAHVVTHRGGKVATMQPYANRNEALEAVGLSE